MSHTQFKKELLQMNGSRPDKIAMYRKLESRTWKKNEKFAQYYHEKVMLATKLMMDEEEIIDHVIDGFNNSTLQSQAPMQSFK